MKANELRIGNIVRFADKDEIPVLSEDIYNFAYGQLELESIPLTEEWLKKFGFFKYNHAYVLKEPSGNVCDFDFSIYDYASDGKETMGLMYNSAEFAPQLKYVHQLQNLYFSLTTEELVITIL